MSRRERDLDIFYTLLSDLEKRVLGRRLLREATGWDAWPQRGVYFLFEPGELRADGVVPRCVRVGTHGLQAGSNSTLWGRLRQHRGTWSKGKAGGNHRGSVFRLHVGQGLINRGDADPAASRTWAQGPSAPRDVRDVEASLEGKVSAVIGAMSVLWVDVSDIPGPGSLRGYLERSCIALLSNHAKKPVDPPSAGWLGHHARAPEIRTSGLWNVNHVAEAYSPGSLDKLAAVIEATTHLG